MGRFSKYQRISKPQKLIHPIWRGIGCLLIVIIPVLSYILGHYLLQEAKQRNLVPAALLGHIKFPEWVWGLPFLDTIARFFFQFEDVWAMLIIFFTTLLLLGGLNSLLYSILYQAFGPARYSELDAPLPRRKTKEYKR